MAIYSLCILRGKGAVITSNGSSYSETEFERNGASIKTVKQTDANGKTTITTTKIGADGVVIVSGSAAPTRRTIQRNVAAAGVDRVDVAAQNGAIHVQRAKRAGQVEVSADVSLGDSRIPAAKARQFIGRFTIAATISGGTLHIRATPPTDFPRGVGFSAAYIVGVPEGPSLHLTTTVGAIDVVGTGVGGTITASTSDGSIKVANSGTSVDAESTTGAIEVTSTFTLTDISAHSDDGSIIVSPMRQVYPPGPRRGKSWCAVRDTPPP